MGQSDVACPVLPLGSDKKRLVQTTHNGDAQLEGNKGSLPLHTLRVEPSHITFRLYVAHHDICRLY